MPRLLKPFRQSICPLLGSPSVKRVLCLPVPLPFLVKDWSFDCLPLPKLCPLLLPLGEMFCCLLLPQPLSDFFLCQCSLLWNEYCPCVQLWTCLPVSQISLETRHFLSSSLQLAPPTIVRCGLGKSCTILRDRTLWFLLCIYLCPCIWNSIRCATHRESCRQPPFTAILTGSSMTCRSPLLLLRSEQTDRITQENPAL